MFPRVRRRCIPNADSRRIPRKPKVTNAIRVYSSKDKRSESNKLDL